MTSYSHAATDNPECSTVIDDIFRAARSGNIERIQACVSKGAEIDSSNVLGQTPLIIAVGMHHKECVRWLLSQGADPNHQDTMDRSPVSNAARIVDDSSILELVLNFKGDPNLKARVRRLDSGFVDGVELTPIYDAIDVGSYENVSLLISKGADVNPKVHKDYVSPLGWAALHYRFDIVHLLLKHGADYRATGPNEHESVAEFLAQVNVDLIIGMGIRDAKERAQWEHEMRNWYFKVCELLKEKESELP